MSASELKGDLLFYAVAGLAGYALLNKLTTGNIFPNKPSIDPRESLPEDKGGLNPDEGLTAPWGAKEAQPFLDIINNLIHGGNQAKEKPAPGLPVVYDPKTDVPIMTPPDMSKLYEISGNVKAYIGRHPALHASDYFAYYPSVAWAEEYIGEHGEYSLAQPQMISYSNQGTSTTLNPDSAPGPAGTTFYNPKIDYTNPNWRMA